MPDLDHVTVYGETVRVYIFNDTSVGIELIDGSEDNTYLPLDRKDIEAVIRNLYKAWKQDRT